MPARGQAIDHLKVDVSIVAVIRSGSRPGGAGAAEELSQYAKHRLAEGLRDDAQSAILLAGLHERPADGAGGLANSAERANHGWWLGLKRRLYGWDKRFTEPLARPRLIEGEAAPVVRTGTLQEAGFTQAGIDRVDAICREWAQEGGEAMGVCIVRNGVIALHKAYGTRNGAPMTVDTPSWMASITKLLSGTLLTMALDQGMIGLEDNPADYVLPWQGIATSKPLTIHQLYTHTAGFRSMRRSPGARWPGAGGLRTAFSAVAKEYFYTGTDMELTMLTLEGITNETLADMYDKHLLGPLDCTRTR